MKKPSLIITIDGPAGCGKSTAAFKLAEHFNLPCIDTGAMYRSVALKALEEKKNPDDEVEMCRLANRLKFKFGHDAGVFYASYSLDAKPFHRLGQEIRSPEVSMGASRVARLPKLRALLVEQQQEIGAEEGGVIEGRDAGTVIFPKAPIKFYITASAEERAKRRHRELREKLAAKAPALEEVLRETIARDQQDENRQVSPMKPAADAVIIDTSKMDLDEVVRSLIGSVQAYVDKSLPLF